MMKNSKKGKKTFREKKHRSDVGGGGKEKGKGGNEVKRWS